MVAEGVKPTLRPLLKICESDASPNMASIDVLNTAYLPPFCRVFRHVMAK